MYVAWENENTAEGCWSTFKEWFPLPEIEKSIVKDIVVIFQHEYVDQTLEIC